MLSFVRNRPLTSLFLASFTGFTGLAAFVIYRNRKLIKLLFNVYKQTQSNDLANLIQGSDMHSNSHADLYSGLKRCFSVYSPIRLKQIVSIRCMIRDAPTREDKIARWGDLSVAVFTQLLLNAYYSEFYKLASIVLTHLAGRAKARGAPPSVIPELNEIQEALVDTDRLAGFIEASIRPVLIDVDIVKIYSLEDLRVMLEKMRERVETVDRKGQFAQYSVLTHSLPAKLLSDSQLGNEVLMYLTLEEFQYELMRRVDVVISKVLHETADFIEISGKNNPWRTSLKHWKGIEFLKVVPFMENRESWRVHEPCEWLSKLVFYG